MKRRTFIAAAPLALAGFSFARVVGSAPSPG
jgi:hypothetical protein